MAIVARGLGLPEDGALVVGGLGVSEADPNAMFATLAGASSVSASLTAAADVATADHLGGLSRRQRVAMFRGGSSSLTVKVSSVAVGVVSTPPLTSTALTVAAETVVVPVPADVAGAGAGTLRVATRSVAAGVRSTFSMGATAMSVAASSFAVGEIAWSISDDEDELFLLLV